MKQKTINRSLLIEFVILCVATIIFIFFSSFRGNFRIIELTFIILPFILIAILLFALFKTKKENKTIKSGTMIMFWNNIILFGFPIFYIFIMCTFLTNCGPEALGIFLIPILGAILMVISYIITVIGLFLKSARERD